MTSVVFKHKDGAYTVRMDGHAGFAESGKDIVCAGASTLAYTLLGFLENYVKAPHVDSIEALGMMHIECRPETEEEEKVCEIAFNMALIGFLQLEKAYPKYVKVDFSEYK